MGFEKEEIKPEGYGKVYLLNRKMVRQRFLTIEYLFGIDAKWKLEITLLFWDFLVF